MTTSVPTKPGVATATAVLVSFVLLAATGIVLTVTEVASTLFNVSSGFIQPSAIGAAATALLLPTLVGVTEMVRARTRSR